MSYTPKSSKEIEASGRYHSFFHGWCDGCSGRAQDPIYLQHDLAYMREEYVAGYVAGLTAKREMLSALTLRTGHMPTVLRSADKAPVSEVAFAAASPA